MPHALPESLTDTSNYNICSQHARALTVTTLINHPDMRMSVAINAVEGYDGVERDCARPANDCNGHYLPAEWTMNPHITAKPRVATGLTHFLSACSVSLHTLTSTLSLSLTHMEGRKQPRSFKPNKGYTMCLQTGVCARPLFYYADQQFTHALEQMFCYCCLRRAFHASIFD